MSPSPWEWDYDTGQYVYYSTTRGGWYNERGEKVRAPKTKPTTAAPHAPAKPIPIPPKPESSQRRGSDAIQDAALSKSFKRVQIQDTATSPREITARDEKTGVSTRWLLSREQQYVDPITGQTRSLTLKRIEKEESEGKGEEEDSGKGARKREGKASRTSKHDYEIGTVIEVEIVQPDTTGFSGYYSVERARRQRLVVVENRPNGADCFRAIPIKTYHGQGVRHQIKRHHSRIYSNKKELLDGEQSNIRVNGQLEDGMQPYPIRVKTSDRTQALDSRSRLDYADVYEIEYGVHGIRTFGTVHQDSMKDLRNQYSIVEGIVRAGIRESTLPAPRRIERRTSNQQLRSPGPGLPRTSGGRGHSRPPAALEKPSAGGPGPVQAPASAPGPPETFSVRHMRIVVERLQQEARNRGLTEPRDLSEQELRSLASDPDARRDYVDSVKERFKQEEDDAEESSSEDERRR